MKKQIFVALLILFLSIAVISIFISSTLNVGGSGKGRMMEVLTLFNLIIPVLMLIGALAVVFYFAMMPDIPLRQTKIEQSDQKIIEKMPLDTSFLEEEEKKVCEILKETGGTLLQKEIVWKTGYSKVKVHRIIYRLAKRGIIEVEKHFNTNKITLKIDLK